MMKEKIIILLWLLYLCFTVLCIKISIEANSFLMYYICLCTCLLSLFALILISNRLIKENKRTKDYGNKVSVLPEKYYSGNLTTEKFLPTKSLIQRIISIFTVKKQLVREGKVTYAIPSEMNLKQAYTCSIKIAFDLETLLKDIDIYHFAYSKTENLLVSSKLKVDVYDVDNEFEIKWLCPQIQRLVKEKASEWIFSVKPLIKEESCLYFCVSVFLDNSENDKVPYVKV